MKKYLYQIAISLLIIISCNTLENNKEKNLQGNPKKDLEEYIKTSTGADIVLNAEISLDAYVGLALTIKGKISNTKIPQILGIDIDYDGDTSTTKIGKVTGILMKTVVPKDTSGIQKAGRGAGTFYHLQSLKGDFMAKVEIINP